MDVSSFTGTSKEPAAQAAAESVTRNVNEVRQITDRKDSENPYQQNSSVSLVVRDHPLQLLLRVVIDKLNDSFPHETRHSNIQNLAEEDQSPAKIANLISLHAISLYEPFIAAEKNAAKSQVRNIEDIKDDLDLFNSFFDGLIRSIENGFDEAQLMLQNLGVLEGTIERDVDAIFLLIQKKLIIYREAISSELQ